MMNGFINNIIAGCIGSIIASIIWILVLRFYIGFKKTRGLKLIKRLVHDSYRGGIINIFPDRGTYVSHKDHGTESGYISNCENGVMYVGYWLAHGTEMGSIIDTVEKLVLNGKKVVLVLMNPKNIRLTNEMSKFLHIDYSEMVERIIKSLNKFIELKNNIPAKYSENLEIKVHNIAINSSAFIIDYNKKESSKILVDYKSYGHVREDSYGIEYNINGIITSNLYESYMKIYKESNEYIKDEFERKSDLFYMGKALEEAKKSRCMRRKVGCVLVQDSQIVASAYNDVILNSNNCSVNGCIRDIQNIKSGERMEVCRGVHAEQKIIIECAKKGINPDGGILYSTHSPCTTCAKLLIEMNIKKIFYSEEYDDRSYISLFGEAGIGFKKIFIKYE